MQFEKTLAHIVAGYLIAVGLFFGFASVFRIPFVDVQPTGKFLVLGVSAVFLLVGIGSFFLLRQGKLKKKGVSMSKVRQRAVEKMKDPELLSRIALKDSDEKLREAAQERLKEMKG
jgi:hypothetical protein